MVGCEQTIMATEFEGSSLKVTDVFTETITDAGYCCSVNTIEQDQQQL